jgi:hypothetical protein
MVFGNGCIGSLKHESNYRSLHVYNWSLRLLDSGNFIFDFSDGYGKRHDSNRSKLSFGEWSFRIKSKQLDVYRNSGECDSLSADSGSDKQYAKHPRFMSDTRNFNMSLYLCLWLSSSWYGFNGAMYRQQYPSGAVKSAASPYI